MDLSKLRNTDKRDWLIAFLIFAFVMALGMAFTLKSEAVFLCKSYCNATFSFFDRYGFGTCTCRTAPNFSAFVNDILQPTKVGGFRHRNALKRNGTAY